MRNLLCGLPLAALLVLPVGALAVGTSDAAFAQPAPSTPPAASNPSGTTSRPGADATAAAHGGAPMAAAGAMQADPRLETHIKRLHDKLGITSPQESAWQAVAQVMRDNAGMIRQGYQERTTHLTSMTALDNMRSYASLAQARAAEAQKMLGAFQPLYDQMSAEQRSKADQVFRAEAERRAEHMREHGQRS